jgi:hypothetical protein
MNGLSIRLSVWCFDQKWWLHAYNGKTTYGLCFINFYLYAYRSNSDFKSILGKSIPLSVSGNTLDRSPHRDTLLGKLTKNLKKDLKAQVLVTLYEEE